MNEVEGFDFRHIKRDKACKEIIIGEVKVSSKVTSLCENEAKKYFQNQMEHFDWDELILKSRRGDILTYTAIRYVNPSDERKEK